VKRTAPARGLLRSRSARWGCDPRRFTCFTARTVVKRRRANSAFSYRQCFRRPGRCRRSKVSCFASALWTPAAAGIVTR